MNTKQLIEKYKDVIPYLFFGVCSLLVNTATYWICAHILGIVVMISTVIAWILAVLFAYLTNRTWVFKSQANTAVKILKETASFFGCRIATGILDLLCMFIFVETLHWNDIIIKTFANILVIVLNYLASKLLIFKKK